LGNDAGKGSDLLALRQRFARVLSGSAFDGLDARQALARYCFDRWEELRASMPMIAEEFYALSRSLDPNLQLPGTWAVKLMSAALGARRAAVVARQLRQLRTAARLAIARHRGRGALMGG
jgi:hypothetical protein